MSLAQVALPPLPRLPPAVPRSGVSVEARRALRQLLEDVDRALATAFRDGIDASALARRRGEAVARVVAHVWTACLGEVGDAALFAVGGFGRGLLFPHSDVDLLALVRDAQPARLRALERFKTGEVQMLVATDVAARGLDIDDLPLVINVDLPIGSL